MVTAFTSVHQDVYMFGMKLLSMGITHNDDKLCYYYFVDHISFDCTSLQHLSLKGWENVTILGVKGLTSVSGLRLGGSMCDHFFLLLFNQKARQNVQSDLPCPRPCAVCEARSHQAKWKPRWPCARWKPRETRPGAKCRCKALSFVEVQEEGRRPTGRWKSRGGRMHLVEVQTGNASETFLARTREPRVGKRKWFVENCALHFVEV